ncbi:hypothetical protein, partial [Bacteroides acidifaciens]|uniref:hypothetical protein n=1 Tax=Bacteroides acidifaciens TaxID=85831 RepID=UPI0025A6875E
MRRDLNVVGGTLDVLSYDYAILKAIINSIQEQMRLQAKYNNYVNDLQKYITITKNVLSIVSGAIKIATALSEFSFDSESMALNTTHTEDFHFPDFPGGGSGGGGGGKFPGIDIVGQFLLKYAANAFGQQFSRYLPSQTDTPAATSSLTATALVLSVELGRDASLSGIICSRH